MVKYTCNKMLVMRQQTVFGVGGVGDPHEYDGRELNLSSDTLRGLVEEIFDEIDVPLKGHVTINFEKGKIASFTYRRTENDGGDPPSGREVAAWRKHQSNQLLFFVDYTFSIQKVRVLPITLEDFRDAHLEIR